MESYGTSAQSFLTALTKQLGAVGYDVRHSVEPESQLGLWAQHTRFHLFAGRLVYTWAVAELELGGIEELARFWDGAVRYSRERTAATRQGRQLVCINVVICRPLRPDVAAHISSAVPQGRAVLEFPVGIDLSTSELSVPEHFPWLLGAAYTMPRGIRSHVMRTVARALDALSV